MLDLDFKTWGWFPGDTASPYGWSQQQKKEVRRPGPWGAQRWWVLMSSGDPTPQDSLGGISGQSQVSAEPPKWAFPAGIVSSSFMTRVPDPNSQFPALGSRKVHHEWGLFFFCFFFCFFLLFVSYLQLFLNVEKTEAWKAFSSTSSHLADHFSNCSGLQVTTTAHIYFFPRRINTTL